MKAKTKNPFETLLDCLSRNGDTYKEYWKGKKWTAQKYTDPKNGGWKSYGAATKPTPGNLSLVWDSLIEEDTIPTEVWCEIDAEHVMLSGRKTMNGTNYSFYYKVFVPEICNTSQYYTLGMVSVLRSVELWRQGAITESLVEFFKVLRENKIMSKAFVLKDRLIVGKDKHYKLQESVGERAFVIDWAEDVIAKENMAVWFKEQKDQPGTYNFVMDEWNIVTEGREMQIEDLKRLEVLYRKGETAVSDADFDEMRMLMNVEEEDITEIREIKSLEKVRDAEKVCEFYRKTRQNLNVDTRCAGLTVSWKLDGCAVRVRFGKDGTMKAITKGKGRDVTEIMLGVWKPRYNSADPKEICQKLREWDYAGVVRNSDFEVTGELVSKEGGREDAAGLLGRKVTEKNRIDIHVYAREFEYVVYDFRILNEQAQRKFEKEHNYRESLQFVKEVFNLPVVGTVELKTETEITRFFDAESVQVMDDDERKELATVPYNVDGIVARVSDLGLYRSMGETKHHAKGAIAFKFEDKQYPVKVKTSESRCGSNGVWKIIITFDPIEIDGKTVQRAYWQPQNAPVCHGFYEKYEAKKEVNGMVKPGDTVNVCLRGKIIPLFSPLKGGK